jgi:hypothetical protein
MAIYTVHEPPLKRDEAAPNPEQFVFVRDRFSFAALLFGPLWMLRHRMWLVLIGYLAVSVTLQVGLGLVGASDTVKSVVMMLLAFLVAFEAATLRRFTLARRGWSNVGLVVGDDVESAERRFFDSWIQRRPQTLPPPAVVPSWQLPPSSTGVIGLFPEPGTSR